MEGKIELDLNAMEKVSGGANRPDGSVLTCSWCGSADVEVEKKTEKMGYIITRGHCNVCGRTFEDMWNPNP